MHHIKIYAHNGEQSRVYNKVITNVNNVLNFILFIELVVAIFCKSAAYFLTIYLLNFILSITMYLSDVE